MKALFTSMLQALSRGEGVVLIQTRNPRSFAEWLKPYLPVSRG